MAVMEFNGENCLKLLRKQFPDTWQAMLRDARKQLNAKRRKMPGVVTVQQAAAACIMTNAPALSIMAASWVMARQEQLLQEHIELDLDLAKIFKKVLSLMFKEGSEVNEDAQVINFCGDQVVAKQERIDEILKEVTDWARTMGDKPHTLAAGGYQPPRWQSGLGFINS